MPYTQEELQTVEFYQEFINQGREKYLERLTKSAVKGFRRGNVVVSFEAIDSGLGIEDANFSDPSYSTFMQALSGPQQAQLLNVLNADYNAWMNDTSNLTGYHAGAGPPQNPHTLHTTSDIPSYISELAITNIKEKQMAEYTKTNTLEKVIDRSITELSETLFAESLPEGMENGDAVTNEFADDSSKWLIQNNQKRAFPDIATFYGSGIPFNKVKSFATSELNKVPDGEPVDL
tara:strand:- start:940 stop:1638 length:699 start_codon:yes stop_codon:yes gene_type:complete